MDEARSDFRRVFRHARAVAGWLVVLLVLLYLASGFYSVKPEERGVVKRFGRVVTDNVPPGIHYHWPWPIESVVRLRTTQIRSLTIRFGNAPAYQGQAAGRQGPATEATQGQPTGATQGQPTEGTQGQAAEGAQGQVAEAPEQAAVVSSQLEATALLTGDENLVLTTLLVQYAINQPKSYLYSTTDPEGLLHRIAHSATIRRYGAMSVDDVLTVGRLEIQTKLKEAIQAVADAYDLGVRIALVQLQTIQPPPDVAGAFRDVASAREDKHKLVRQAEGDANRRIPRARAEANTERSQAETYAKETVEMASGDAERFLAAWDEYRKAKDVTAHRLYLEAIEEILPKVRKLISNPQAERYIPVPRTSFAKELGIPMAEPETQPETSSPE